jgi:uncharacterized protein YecE (DUF72 family)
MVAKRLAMRNAEAQRIPEASLIRIGCSGWQYRHWRGDFYPDTVPLSRWLEYYASHFDTVEINNSFYRLPEAATFEAWHSRVPPPFVFAVKASRYLTHMKKLNDPEPAIDRLFSRVTCLGRSLGPVLYQLPPRWPVNLPRLQTFLAALPPAHTHVIEFRDPSWYSAEVFAALQMHNVSLCLHDMEGSATGLHRVGPIIYLRCHGPAKYQGGYSDRRLAELAEWCAAHTNNGTPLYAYFNNDIGGHAPRDAARFRAMAQLSQRRAAAGGLTER